jgi:ribosomal protein S19E (S16A)
MSQPIGRVANGQRFDLVNGHGDGPPAPAEVRVPEERAEALAPGPLVATVENILRRAVSNSCRSVRARLEAPDLRLDVRLDGPAPRPPAGQQEQAGVVVGVVGPLSPLERQILELLDSEGRMYAKVIGARTGHLDGSGQASTKLRMIISNLADRGLLDNLDTGYVITPAGKEALHPLAERVSDGLLSPLERDILLSIGRDNPNATAVGEATGQLDETGQASYQVRTILTNLCDRGILTDDDGYRLTPIGLELFARMGGEVATEAPPARRRPAPAPRVKPSRPKAPTAVPADRLPPWVATSCRPSPTGRFWGASSPVGPATMTTRHFRRRLPTWPAGARSARRWTAGR